MKTIYTYIESKDKQRVIHDYNLNGAKLPNGVKPGDKVLYGELLLYQDSNVKCKLIVIKIPTTGEIITRQTTGTYLHINMGVSAGIKPKNCGIIATAEINRNDKLMNEIREAYDKLVSSSDDNWVESEWYEYVGIDNKEKYKTPFIERDTDFYIELAINGSALKCSRYDMVADSPKFKSIMDECLTTTTVRLVKEMAKTNNRDEVMTTALKYAKVDAYMINQGKRPL